MERVNSQPMDLFSLAEQSRMERDTGISRAIDHADKVSSMWSNRAMQFLSRYLASHQEEFMTENFRSWAENAGLDQPPSGRAYGGIMVRAAKSGWIKSTGYGKTINPKSHCTPATKWKKC